MSVKSATARGLSSGLEPGLVFLTTQTFSAATSVSLADNTFTDAYDHYKMFMTLSSTPSAYMIGRIRVAGSDNSTSNYAANQIQAAYASTTLGNDNQGINTNAFTVAFVDGNRTNISMDLMNPKATAFTTLYSHSDRPGYGQQVNGGVFKLTTSADSFSFIPQSGNITGTVTVYGYTK